jgi:hypothetical protein
MRPAPKTHVTKLSRFGRLPLPSVNAQVHANIAALGYTVIIIVHRLASVIDADLLAARGHYAQLVAGQLVGETPR